MHELFANDAKLFGRVNSLVQATKVRSALIGTDIGHELPFSKM